MTKRDLEAALAAARQQNARLKNVGEEMAALCFNGKQRDDMPADYRESMALLVERWDAAMRNGEGSKA